MTLIRIIYVYIILMFLPLPVQAQQIPETSSSQLIINLPSRTIELYINNVLVKNYPIAIGKPSTPTPLGRYLTLSKEINPTWYPPDQNYAVPSGPDNPLGYRWIGFSGNYGIHGTNAPWSITYAVSNGCIRMYEEDVEELFELIPYGTPINITYDRFYIRKNNNKLYIQVFPDVYGYKSINVKEIKNKLKHYHLDNFISDNKIAEIIAAESEQPIILAEYFDVKINNTTLIERGIKVNEHTFIPIKAIADHIQLPLTVNKTTQQVLLHNNIFPAYISDNNIYINYNDFKKLGGVHNYNKQTNCLESILPILYINNQPITTDVSIANRNIRLPFAKVWDYINRYGSWNTVQKNLLKPLFMAKDNFISIENTLKLYRTYVIYNRNRNRIDITYLSRYLTTD